MLAAHATAAPIASSTVITVLLALLSGGLLAEIARIYMRWRKGPIDDALQMQQAQDLARKASQELFVSYRVELEDAKKQLSEYLSQLIQVHRDLGAAEARISKLEQDLREARVEAGALREELNRTRAIRDELDGARRKRDELQAEVSTLLTRIGALERRVKDEP